MTLIFVSKDANPMYIALSTDIVDNKIAGASVVGGTVYLTDEDSWRIIETDTTLGDYNPVGDNVPVTIISPLESNGAVPVNIQDQHTEGVCLYLYRTDATPTLTSSIAIDDTVFDIDDNANISDGDAITLFEGIKFYQSLVVSSTATTVTVATPCDKIYTVAASIEVGPWNMAVDGSTVSQTFHIHPPPGVDFDIYTITISGLDDLGMDSTTFLGIVDGITNGVVIRAVNGTIKNMGLFVNNLGLEEFGYSMRFPPINKKSEYGMVARKNIRESNGISIRLRGADEDTIEVIIRDALQSQSLMAVIMNGHVVTD